MTNLNNLKNATILSVACLLTSNFASAQIIGTGTYMFGNYVEVAINNARGMEGAPNVLGHHSRSNIGTANPVYYGFVANPQMNAWLTYDGDFFTPGTPENGFGLEIAGVNYSNNSASTVWNQIPGGLTSYTTLGDCIIVQWDGNVAGCHIKIVYKMELANVFYTTTVTLTNNTASPMVDLYYYRNFDPDNNVTIGGSYVTTNKIVAQPVPGCEKAYVTGTQTAPWASYVGLGGLNTKMRVAYGGFSNRDASNIWNGIGFTSAVGATSAGDVAIALAYKTTLAPAASETFVFCVVMSAASYDIAMSNLYSFSFVGASSTAECIPVVDTAYTCPGDPVVIDVIGPGVGGYTWSWSPTTALSPSTGPSVTASPMTTTTYTVTGTPLACLTTPLIKTIVVKVLPTPNISITPPGTQCETFALSSLVVNDLAGVPGAVTNFFSVVPDSIDQTVGLLPPGYIMTPGDVVYVAMGNPSSPSGCFDYEPVIITFDFFVNAGPDVSSSNCSGAGVLDLDPMLIGADPGGVWAETTIPPGGGLSAGTGDYDISGLTPGTYTITYTIDGGACPDDFAVISLTVETEVNAGLDNSATLCNNTGTTLDLDGLLSGADPGGFWTETSGTPSGGFTPATGVLTAGGVPAGVYTFTYTVPAVAPCLTDVATMTITINAEANAGADNTAQICNSPGSTINLNTLVTGSAGGLWTETTIPLSGTFNAFTGVFTTSGLTAGAYTFTYWVNGVAPCVPDVASFTVTVSDLPTAGLDNSATDCNDAGSTIDLNTLLSGADPGGVWAETSASGAFTPATGILNSAGAAAGVYTFTYTLAPVGPCPGDVANFTITVNQMPNAGGDNTTTLCNQPGSNINMNTLVLGTAGGAWVETSASGSFVPATGIFTAAGLAAGVYTFTYTVAGVAPCPSDVANFSVTVSDLPNAGPDNANALCNIAGTTIDLDVLLAGADPGGVWSDVSGAGAAFTSATGVLDASGVTAGVYVFNYDLAPMGPCPGDQAVITITIQQEAIAGPDNSSQLCNTAGTVLDLNTLLSGAAAGTWTETSGTASGGFTPATGMLSAAGVAAGVYTFDYTVAAVAPCVPDVATFTVTIQQEVNAGTDNVTQACNYAGATVNLNTLLAGADVGGTWAETTSSGGFTPASGILTLTGVAGGMYSFTYTMTGVAPCPNDVANFTVTVDQYPTVTTIGDEQMCDADGHVTPVFGSDVPGTSFTWSNTTGTDVGFGLAGAGNIGGYTASGAVGSDVVVVVEVIPTSPAGCVGAPETFNVTIHPLPDPTFSGNDLVGCAPLQVTFTGLGAGASCDWTFGDGNTTSACGVVSNYYETPGLYTVSLTVTSAYGCVSSFTIADYVSVTPVAEAHFTYSPIHQINVDNTEVTFTNSSINADMYTWDFGDGSANSSDENPTHIFPNLEAGEYTVTLYADNAGGCPDQTSVIIRVEDIILFFVPNAFTPDGNSYNDDFRPIMTAGYDIYDYHFTIFNRWGEIVFESHDAQYGWDGTYGDRGVVESGAYVWALEFGETMSDKKHKHRGHVTILK